MPHLHKLIDFTVVAFIVFKNKVLLVRHKELQKWLPVGGHIELNENPEQALFREVQEETGIEVEILAKKPNFQSKERKALLPPTFLDIHKINGTHRHIGMVYFAKAKSDNAKLAENEHYEMRWFTEKDLKNPRFNLQKDVKFYIREALKKARQ